MQYIEYKIQIFIVKVKIVWIKYKLYMYEVGVKSLFQIFELE